MKKVIDTIYKILIGIIIVPAYIVLVFACYIARMIR